MRGRHICAALMGLAAGALTIAAPFVLFLIGRGIVQVAVTAFAIDETMAIALTGTGFIAAIFPTMLGVWAGQDAYDAWQRERRWRAEQIAYERRLLEARFVRVHRAPDPPRKAAPVSWGDSK